LIGGAAIAAWHGCTIAFPEIVTIAKSFLFRPWKMDPPLVSGAQDEGLLRRFQSALPILAARE